MAFVRILNTLLRDKKIGQPGGADRAGRVAHLRHGGDVPAVRHLLPERSAVPAGGRQPADVLPGGPDRPDAAGGHHRARRDVVLDRGRDRLQHVGHADDPVLHLLLDVRFPAGRRPGLGGRATAGPADSWSAAPPGAPPSTARGCSTRTGTATSSRRRSPTASSYDPTFGYEVAVIVHDGLRRMYAEQEDVYYYLTVMNENYQHPADAGRRRGGILRGMYLLREGRKQKGKPRVQLLGSGTILREVHRRRRPAGGRLRRRRRRVERAELHRAAARRAGHRALEHAAPHGITAAELRRDLPGRPARARWSPRPTT